MRRYDLGIGSRRGKDRENRKGPGVPNTTQGTAKAKSQKRDQKLILLCLWVRVERFFGDGKRMTRQTYQ